MIISWWNTGVMLPDMGGTIQTQSPGQPPLTRTSFSMCLMKDSVAAWWSPMVTLDDCRGGGGDRNGEVNKRLWVLLDMVGEYGVLLVY